LFSLSRLSHEDLNVVLRTARKMLAHRQTLQRRR
jgi:hypothetical protein